MITTEETGEFSYIKSTLGVPFRKKKKKSNSKVFKSLEQI